MNNIQESEDLRQEAWNSESKHCQDCDYNFKNPERDDEPESSDCTCNDAYQCPAVAAVYGMLSDLAEEQSVSHAYFEEALGNATDDLSHLADANNTEGLLRSVKDALRAARFEQAKSELI